MFLKPNPFVPFKPRQIRTRKTVKSRIAIPKLKLDQAFQIYRTVYNSLKLSTNVSSFRIPNESFYIQLHTFASQTSGGGGKFIDNSVQTTFNNNNSPTKVSSNFTSSLSWQSKITIDLIVSIAIILSCVSDQLTPQFSLPISQALANTMKNGVPLTKNNFKMTVLRSFLKNLSGLTNKKNNFNKMLKFIDFLTIFVSNFYKSPLFSTYGFFAKPLITAFVKKEIDCDSSR
jgi:hypothetical protein